MTDSRDGKRPTVPAETSWVSILDRLEEDLHDLELAPGGLATVIPRSWEPPQELGPIPPHLQVRAVELAARQHRQAAEVARQLLAAARQLRLVDDIDGVDGHAHRPAVFVDVTA